MYLAKLDIKDAYYSIQIHKESLKLLVLSLYYGKGLKKFTKITKPSISKLRKEQVTIADNIDNIITMDVSNSSATIMYINSLGFTIHPEKSEFKPKQVLEFLYLSLTQGI